MPLDSQMRLMLAELDAWMPGLTELDPAAARKLTPVDDAAHSLRAAESA